jgi:ribosomal protein S18 acetylase RimI-like enzyme
MFDNSISIRQFIKSDREDIRRISCDTAFLDTDNKLFFDNDDILADVLTLYYTDYEPQSCFVAVEKDRVIGYIIGSKNTRRMDIIFNKKILPKLIGKAFIRGIFFRGKNLKFLSHIAVSFIRGEFFVPDFSKQYPATLHININGNFRGRRIGEKLIEHYLNYLKEEKVRGIHFGTMSEKAKDFFIKNGFSVLFESKHSYLRYVIKQNTPYYILGRKL